MSDQDGELTDFPEMDQADVSAATGIVPQADPGDEDPAQTTGAAGGDDDPAADPPPANDPAAELPAYRREAIANRENQELQSRIDRLERLLDKQNTPPPSVTPVKTGKELTPEQQAQRESVKAKFYEVWPEAKDLFEKAEQILKAADVAPGIAAQAEQADNFRAESAEVGHGSGGGADSGGGQDGREPPAASAAAGGPSLRPMGGCAVHGCRDGPIQPADASGRAGTRVPLLGR